MAIAFGKDLTQLGVHEGAEHQGRDTVFVGGVPHPGRRRLRLLGRIDEGKASPGQIEARKLGQEAASQDLGGDAGAIGDEEESACHGLGPMCAVEGGRRSPCGHRQPRSDGNEK